MTSKVSGKTRLGAVCCVLLIAIALFAGCKQETPESYAPPGYGVSIGPITDSTWTYRTSNGDESLRFEANGKVSVPESMKTKTFYGKKIELGDFTYELSNSRVVITGTVKKLPNGEESQTFTYKIDENSSSSNGITINVGDTTVIETLTINGTVANDSTKKIGPYSMIDDEYELTYSTTVPTAENYVGTYTDDRGRKNLEINKDGTWVSYTGGNRTMKYWKYVDNNDEENGIVKGTIWVAADEDQLVTGGSYTVYTLYPHGLVSSSGSTISYWK
jgi:hypothetical protein